MSRPPVARPPREPLGASVQEAAHHYTVSQRTVRRWIADGRLTAVRVGPRLIRVRLDDLDAMVRPIPVGGPDAK